MYPSSQEGNIVFCVRKENNLSVIRFLLRVIDFVSDTLGKVMSLYMTLVIFVLIYGVIQRYVFGNPWRWESIATNVLTGYVMLGAAFALRSGAFVNIDILQRRMPLRVKAIASMATYILFFLFCLAFLSTAIPVGLPILARTKLSYKLITNPGSWPVRSFFMLGVGLLMVQGLAKFTRDLITAVTGKEEA